MEVIKMGRIDEIVEPDLKRVEEILTPVDLQGDFSKQGGLPPTLRVVENPGDSNDGKTLNPIYLTWKNNGQIFIYRVDEQTPMDMDGRRGPNPGYKLAVTFLSGYNRVTPPKKLVAIGKDDLDRLADYLMKEGGIGWKDTKGVLTPDDLRKYSSETISMGGGGQWKGNGDYIRLPGGIGYLVVLMPGSKESSDRGTKTPPGVAGPPLLEAMRKVAKSTDVEPIIPLDDILLKKLGVQCMACTYDGNPVRVAPMKSKYVH